MGGMAAAAAAAAQVLTRRRRVSEEREMPIWRAARRERGEGGGAARGQDAARKHLRLSRGGVGDTDSQAGGRRDRSGIENARRERAKWRRISRTCCPIHRIHGEDG